MAENDEEAGAANGCVAEHAEEEGAAAEVVGALRVAGAHEAEELLAEMGGGLGLAQLRLHARIAEGGVEVVLNEGTADGGLELEQNAGAADAEGVLLDGAFGCVEVDGEAEMVVDEGDGLGGKSLGSLRDDLNDLGGVFSGAARTATELDEAGAERDEDGGSLGETLDGIEELVAKVHEARADDEVARDEGEGLDDVAWQENHVMRNGGEELSRAALDVGATARGGKPEKGAANNLLEEVRVGDVLFGGDADDGGEQAEDVFEIAGRGAIQLEVVEESCVSQGNAEGKAGNFGNVTGEVVSKSAGRRDAGLAARKMLTNLSNCVLEELTWSQMFTL